MMNRMLQEIQNRGAGVAFWWVGNAGWVFGTRDLLLGIDLDLEMAQKVRRPVVLAEELAPLLDVAFVTHHHGDHSNRPTLGALTRLGRCEFVLPKTCLGKAIQGLRIPRRRIIVPEPLSPFIIRGMRVEPLHAIHGNQEFTVLTREPDFVDSIRWNCGYVFELGGLRIFHPGDSVLTEEHLALKNIDVLFISPTVHNMYIDRSALLIEHLKPRYILPQHFKTYRETKENRFWTRGYPDELRKRLSPSMRKRYHKLAQGEKFVVVH